MSLISPWWLLLALGAALPWVGPWRGSNRIQNVLRSLVFVFLAAAMARPHLLQENAPARRVLVLDASSSLSDEAASVVIDEAREFSSGGRKANTHLVLFGQNSEDARSQLAGRFGEITVLGTDGPEGSSPISAALAHAATLVPRNGTGSVTLVTDGLATRPDDARATTALHQREIPVHTVRVPAESDTPVCTSVEILGDLRVGMTGRIRARIVNRSEAGSSAGADFVLSIDGNELARAALAGRAVEEVELRIEPPSAGFLNATVSIERTPADDDDTGDGTELSTTEVVLPVRTPIEVIYLGNRQQGAAERLKTLLGPGVKLTQPAVDDRAAFRSQLATADLAMIDDRPADTVPESVEADLVDAVTNGGLGLVMSGGRAGFGMGGWHDRPIEELLPVELVQKEEKRDPSTSLVVVIDTSGSMSGVRVQLAKEVSRLAMQRLMPHDKVGIVEFYGAKRWAAPLQPASNAIELQRALNRMDAGGGTVILPALEEAFYGLQNVDTRYKHVLVLTDGGVESGDFESLLRRMSKEGINVSTVLAGGGYHSEFLVNIANWGKGRFYNVPDRFSLPEILLKQPSTSKLPAYRPGQHVVQARGGSGWWGEVNAAEIPDLAGYVETKPRTGSELLLETVEGRHPVLSTWQYGLGRVTALTTEPVGEGTQPWEQWPDYGRMLARIIERTAADSRDPFRFEVGNDGGQVVIHAIRQQSRGGGGADVRPVAVRLNAEDSDADADAAEAKLSFVARSPDHFLAKLPMPAAGTAVRIEAASTVSPDRKVPIVASSTVSDELRVDPDAELDLAAVSKVTGGSSVDVGEAWPASESESRGYRLVPLSTWLFAAALLLFLAEIVWRRLPNRDPRMTAQTGS